MKRIPRAHFDKILILDFGSQYTQLIARRVRECRIYSEIHPYDISAERVKSSSPKGMIFSGGPASVYEKKAPRCDPALFKMGIPILGICYGMQLIGHLLGGEVHRSEKREYGKARLVLDRSGKLFRRIGGKGRQIEVWMSHGDQIKTLPSGFHAIAHSKNPPFAAIEDIQKKIYGLQFHPEVVHTPKGLDIIKNFLFNICECSNLWSIRSFLKQTISDLRRR